MTTPRLPRLANAFRERRPTLFFRCLLVLLACLLANGILWTVSAIVFTRDARNDPQRDASQLLSLCLLAWTLGLRHALDADHIAIIDSATRRIASLYRYPDRPELGSRRPVTCGLFFSLGHSTIVVSVLIAVAVSTSVVNHLGGVGEVGGIIGASVSGSFLFLFGVINSILLWRSWRSSRKFGLEPSSVIVSPDLPTTQDGEVTGDSERKDPMIDGAEKAPMADDEPKQATTDMTAPGTHLVPGQNQEIIETKEALSDPEAGSSRSKQDRGHFRGLFTRLVHPLLRLVDRPYKLYPIGILFGFGFDTASSIALLGVAAATNTTVVQQNGEPVEVAAQNEGGRGVSDASVVLLALLFTAGMTLVDSCDSVLMINAYAPGELWPQQGPGGPRSRWALFEPRTPEPEGTVDASELVTALPSSAVSGSGTPSTATTLSQVLTLASIILAFAISAIQILGLIGEECARCSRAADLASESGSQGGLEGRWWLFWRQCGEQSGVIGAGIVGAFALVLATWYIGRAVLARYRSARTKPEA